MTRLFKNKIEKQKKQRAFRPTPKTSQSSQYHRRKPCRNYCITNNIQNQKYHNVKSKKYQMQIETRVKIQRHKVSAYVTYYNYATVCLRFLFKENFHHDYVALYNN